MLNQAKDLEAKKARTREGEPEITGSISRHEGEAIYGASI